MRTCYGFSSLFGRIDSGVAVTIWYDPNRRVVSVIAALSALLALNGSAPAADPTVATPQLRAEHKTAAPTGTPTPLHVQTQPAIPSVTLDRRPYPLSEPPAPREPLALETDLLPLNSPTEPVR